MKLLDNSHTLIAWVKKIREGLIEPAPAGDARERYLSRTLSIILLFLLAWGTIFEIQSGLLNRPFNRTDAVVTGMLCILGLAYILNRSGMFIAASTLTVGMFSTATLVSAFVQHLRGSKDLSILYYLIIPILISELFFSTRAYLWTAAILLAGVLGLSLLDPDAINTFVFLLVFSALTGFFSYSRRASERQPGAVMDSLTCERCARGLDRRRSVQLGLLEEVGRQVADSLDEKEILDNTLEALVNKFGYAEAVISLLVDEDTLEIVAITGTQDFGYRPGYRQKTSRGIIGHVAKTRTAHIAEDVSRDPYYFSSAPRYGSALGVPILDKEHLLGIIYVESNAKHDFDGDDQQTLQTLGNQVATSLQKARLYARTQDHLQVMTVLQSISRAVTSSLELEEIFNNVIRLLKDSLGYSYISIFLLENDVLHLGTQIGYPEDKVVSEMPITMGVIGRAARSRETQFIRDVSTDPDYLRASYEVRSEICVPLLKEQNVLGILDVECDNTGTLNENDVSFLNALAGSIAVAIDNARLHAEVKQMAMTDAVCGLANRRYFNEILNAEMARAIRYSNPLSLIIIDLDSFKEYNDRWGHPAGDVRLKEIADMLRRNVREPDIAARHGGEEFAIILPHTSKMGAIRLAERLRRAAADSTPDSKEISGPVPGYTISLGVATFPDDAATMEDLILMADNAELLAKKLGKNQVCAANTSETLVI
ncbi:MAG: diguanylate cyclase [Anaerolineales bacterium]